MMDKEIIKGSVVRLKSGGCAMTVASINVFTQKEEKYQCVWLAENGLLQQAWFPLCVLRIN
jgi:uncharacterized protein YodC (DUF2158 family)